MQRIAVNIALSNQVCMSLCLLLLANCWAEFMIAWSQSYYTHRQNRIILGLMTEIGQDAAGLLAIPSIIQALSCHEAH